MGFFEGVGQLCLMSKTPKHEYIVLDQYDRQYRVTATDADEAESKVIHDHPFTVHANRVRAHKIKK
jgi:hypothetical protein